MSEKVYQIVVTGELMEGTYLPDVKAKLAAMFNTPAEKLDPLFSGNRVVIKKGLGEEGAKKYLAAVQAAGLRCAAEDMAEKAPQASPAATMADVSLAPVGTTLIEAPKVKAPAIDITAYSVAPVGETLIEPPSVMSPEIDISDLSMAAVGEDLVERAPPEAPAIDTSALSVAPPGTQLVEKEEIPPPAIDTSNLDMAPVGSDVGEKKREDGPPPPDTSHLKLD
jgi:hypothetical protein